jgi:chaperonin GroES
MKKSNGKKTNILPLGSRILIRPFTKEELEKKSNFGIILPENDKEKSEQGEVLAVGPGEYRDGKLIKVNVNVGDKVVFSKYGYDEVKVDDEEYYLIKEDNILAIIK